MIDIKKVLGKITNNDYSTSEIKTGKKWIDGKPIYRKTIDLGYMPSNTTAVPVNHNIPNIDTIVDANGLFIWEDGSTAMNPYIANVETLYGCMFLTFNHTRITKFASTDRHTIKAYATLEYTKTTD